MLDAHPLPSPPAPRRRSHPLPRLVAGLLLAALLAIGAAPRDAAAASTYAENLWAPGTFVYQDPYLNACTAAAAMHMLNTIAARGTGGEGFGWSTYRIKKNDDPDDLRDMTSILRFARRHDTLDDAGKGSDPHGWRNALNYYGWGEAAMLDPSLMPYQDKAYATFDAAVRAAVRSIARKRMPVGLLAWAGGHAQVMTGYVVTGQDPRVSKNFSIVAVYLSDPLRADETVNRRLSYEQLRSGSLKIRFRAYRHTDSPFDDPYTDGVIPGSIPPRQGPSEWYGRYVIIKPVRNGLPAPTGGEG